MDRAARYDASMPGARSPSEAAGSGPASAGSGAAAARAGAPGPALDTLLAGVAARDEAAFERFFAATRGWVLGVARTVLRDHHDAEEVVVDVYRQVWDQAARYRAERGRPETWLLVLTRSRAVDRLRAAAVRRGRERPLERGGDPTHDGAEGAPARRLEHHESGRRLLAALAALPEEQARLIRLAFLDGLTHTRIAERTGEPLGTVKTRIRRGMLKLRELLGAQHAREDLS